MGSLKLGSLGARTLWLGVGAGAWTGAGAKGRRFGIGFVEGNVLMEP